MDKLLSKEKVLELVETWMINNPTFGPTVEFASDSNCFMNLSDATTQYGRTYLEFHTLFSKDYRNDRINNLNNGENYTKMSWNFCVKRSINYSYHQEFTQCTNGDVLFIILKDSIKDIKVVNNTVIIDNLLIINFDKVVKI